MRHAKISIALNFIGLGKGVGMSLAAGRGVVGSALGQPAMAEARTCSRYSNRNCQFWIGFVLAAPEPAARQLHSSEGTRDAFQISSGVGQPATKNK
jgi:hypothetical protein